MLFTFVLVCFESFRRDLNEAKAVYISVIKINVLLFSFVRVFFEFTFLSVTSSANISILASFRRDLNEAKAVYISECNVVG